MPTLTPMANLDSPVNLCTVRDRETRVYQRGCKGRDLTGPQNPFPVPHYGVCAIKLYDIAFIKDKTVY